MSAAAIEFDKVHGTFTSAFVKSLKVTKVSGGTHGFSAIVYQTKLNVDWDGSPVAYGLDNPRDAQPAGLAWNSKTQTYARSRQDHFQRNLKPVEFAGLHGGLRDATNNVTAKDGLFFNHNFKWVGVVSATPGEAKAKNLWIDDRAMLKDKFGKFPVIQKDGPTRGYYVSQSGSPANSGSQFSQSTFWDAANVPYCVWPSSLGNGVKLGDFGLAIVNGTGRSSGFFFADTGSTNKVGECSGGLTTFIVFPKSGTGSATQGQDGLIKGKVGPLVAKLSGVPNAEEFIRFLAMGADPDTFAKSNYDAIKSKSFFPPPGSAPATYENIRRALREWGFRSARQRIDISSAVLPPP
jgi:hypothetical protein